MTAMFSQCAMPTVDRPPEPVQAARGEMELWIPDGDVADPELSIVIPAMNERVTVAALVEWCKAGMARAGIAGEILIVDSSTDETPGIALTHGARVLRTPKRGLGRAYIDAIPYIRGKYVLMGDADCTYDFREIDGFIQEFRRGAEFIMGSRLRGRIEPHAMPALHRYFGTPLTTWILNVLYATNFSDIHCGMRGVTRAALVRMELESQSWEYASEMVLKAVCLKLKTAEVPVRFLKDPQGRLSHMKRNGWQEPWRAGWINLRAMLLYGADFFLLRPGLALLAVGLALTVPVSLGPVRLGPVTLSLNWMMLGLTLAVVGLECFYLGCIAQVIYRHSAESAARWLRLLAYDRAMLASALLSLAGLALELPLVHEYLNGGLRLPPVPSRQMHLAVLGLFCLVAAFHTFSCTLVLHAADLRVRRRRL
jgi:Glycosyl transferase family 2